MGSKLYSRSLNLIKAWPVDNTRIGRDLGESLRSYFGRVFPLGAGSKINEKEVAANVEAISRLSNNHHAKKFPRTFSSNATGTEESGLRRVTSVKFLEILNNSEEKTLWSNLKELSGRDQGGSDPEVKSS